MFKLSFFKKKAGREQLVQQAELVSTQLAIRQVEIAKDKDAKTHRQVELWSVLTPSPDLERDYKNVTLEIAILIKQSLAIEDYLKQLHLARFHCQENDCEELTRLLSIDPCANITPDQQPLDFPKPATASR